MKVRLAAILMQVLYILTSPDSLGKVGGRQFTTETSKGMLGVGPRGTVFHGG